MAVSADSEPAPSSAAKPALMSVCMIIGAAGMVGRKLTERLARDGALGGREIAKKSQAAAA